MPKSADDLRRERKAAADAMSAAAETLTSLEAGADATAAQAAFDKAEADFKAADNAVKIAERVEAAQAAAAVPARTLTPAAGPQGGGAAPAQVAEKGIRLARMTRYLAAAGGIPRMAQEFAEQDGHSGLFANQNMGSGPAGGFLVPEDVSSEFIELLRPLSVVMRGNPMMVPMPNGNLTMNRQVTGAMFGYTGEQQDIGATGLTLGQLKLSAKKLTGLIPISNDLLRSASLAVDRLVLADILAGSAVAMDTAFLRSAGGDNAPLGLRHQLTGTALAATNILAVTAGNTLASITGDLGRMELALLNANVPLTGAAWIGAPRSMMRLRNIRDGNGNFAFPEMQQGRLRNLPFFDTTTIPINLGGGSDSELYLVAFPHVLIGEQSGLSIETFNGAAYRDAAGNLQSGTSRDETIMRAIQHHDIGLRHLAAVAILTGVNWADA